MVTEVRRRFTYVSKKETDHLAGLVAHIGSRWEPITGTFRPGLKPDELAHLKLHVNDYYRKHPRHPYHPKRRPALDPFCMLHTHVPSIVPGEYSEYLDKVLAAIDKYNSEHDDDADA